MHIRAVLLSVKSINYCGFKSNMLSAGTLCNNVSYMSKKKFSQKKYPGLIGPKVKCPRANMSMIKKSEKILPCFEFPEDKLSIGKYRYLAKIRVLQLLTDTQRLA